MKKIILLPIIISFLLCISCSSYTDIEPIEIPFVIENNRIILIATVNGDTGKYVFDTGSARSYIPSKFYFPVGYTKKTLNGKLSNVFIYKLTRLQLGNTILHPFSNVINKTDDSIISILNNEKYSGLLSHSVFNGYWCELSFSKNKIILYKEKPSLYTNLCKTEPLQKYYNDYTFPIEIDNKRYYLLFDTGLDRGIYFPEGVIKDKQIEDCKRVVTTKLCDNYSIVSTNTISILDCKLKKKKILTNSYLYKRTRNEKDINTGLIGIQFIKNYDWLLDCTTITKWKTSGFYYRSHKINTINYGFFSFLDKEPYLGVIDYSFTNNGIVLKSIIEKSIGYEKYMLRPGDMITEINGRKYSTYTINDFDNEGFLSDVSNYKVIRNNVETLVEINAQ